MIYIKSIVVVLLNNNKLLVISTCIDKDLFIILPITNIYVCVNARLKLKKKKKKIQAQQEAQPDKKLATHTSY